MENHFPAADRLTADKSGPVAILPTRNVPGEHARGFEAGLRELISAATTQPGHLHAEVLRGARIGSSQDCHIVYRFADQRSLRSCQATPERNTLLARLAALAIDAGRRKLTGMEAWFDLRAHLPPPRAKMALLTWLGIWPPVTTAQLRLAPRLSTAPLIARTAIITALLVLAMTYLVMTRLAQLPHRSSSDHATGTPPRRRRRQGRLPRQAQSHAGLGEVITWTNDKTRMGDARDRR